MLYPIILYDIIYYILYILLYHIILYYILYYRILFFVLHYIIWRDIVDAGFHFSARWALDRTARDPKSLSLKPLVAVFSSKLHADMSPASKGKSDIWWSVHIQL